MTLEEAPLQDKIGILRELQRLEPQYRFNPDVCYVETATLPFYPEAILIHLVPDTQRGDDEGLWYVRLKKGEVVALDGSTANIHYLNVQAPLLLSDSTIEPYLKFRLYFAGGNLLEESRCEAAGMTGAWQAKARVHEKDGLYEATLLVSKEGKMTEEQKEKLSSERKTLAFKL